jgi:hypothetical protein
MKARYHLPSQVTWRSDAAADDKARFERVILSAIERALSGRAGPNAEIVRPKKAARHEGGDPFAPSRYSAAARTYGVPSYDQQGEPVDVPVVSFEDDKITVTPDRVIEDKPPFEGALVLALPGQHIHVGSHRYAATTNPQHAVTWGKLLFGASTWIVASQRGPSGELLYYTASLDETISEGDLRVTALDAKSRAAPGVSGVFFGLVLPVLPGGWAVESVYFPGGGRTAPSSEAFAEFADRIAAARKEQHAGLDPALVRRSVFGVIDGLLATGKEDDLERAADLLAELNAVAFSLLDPETRARYLAALVKAWTSDPQEKAIVEIFKSVADATELQTIIDMLKKAGVWDQMFDDLDNELWSLLVALGERFGGKTRFSFHLLEIILLGEQLIPFTPSVRRTEKGLEVSLEVVAESYEAARSFIRFVGGFIESLWMFVAHPDKLVDAVDQLVRLSITVQLAQMGDPEAIKAVEAALAGMTAKARDALQGAAIAGLEEKVLRRVKWAIIFEVASWFVGAGELKAVAESVGFSEKLAVLGRLLGLARLTEKTAEGAKVATKLETLARLASETGTVFKGEEEALRLLSRLPPEDVTRLAAALEKADVHEAAELARLVETHAEIGDALRKAEVLGEFARRAGQLTDDVAEAFARLSREARMSPEEIRRLLRAIPDGQHASFARTVRAIPPSAFVPGGVGASFLQRQAGAALRNDAAGLERQIASLREEAEALERKASALPGGRAARANRLRQGAAQRRRIVDMLTNDVDDLNRQAVEFESGLRSATAELPGPEDVDLLLAEARSETGLIEIPLSRAERDPMLLPRLVRPLLQSRTGNRVVFRVEGGIGRELVQIGENGSVTLAKGTTIHLNFGSYERALEFLGKGRGRIVAFEVEEAWIRSARSAAIPEHGTGALKGRVPRLVDIRFAEDQLETPAQFVDELQKFVVQGSGRVLKIGN